LTDAQANSVQEANIRSVPQSAQYTDEQIKSLANQELMMSAAFARMVSVLMRSPTHKHLALTDLEWFIVRPLIPGQITIIDAKVGAIPLSIPAAVLLWAQVSTEIDERLSNNLAVTIRLCPDEWRSGDIPWIIDVIALLTWFHL
jgi:hemolysin-activating ACP:hemolysin acyltransferase